MRAPILLLTALAALAVMPLVGCERAIERSVTKSVAEHAAAPGQEWSLQIAGAGDEDAVFLVTGPNGQSAAARVAGDVSTLIDVTEAQGLMAAGTAALAADPPPERVVIGAPGFSLKVSADDDDSSGRGQVRINVGGVSVNVDGADAHGKSGVIQIGGVNEEAALKFIEDIDNLSPEVKQQMRTKLGL